MLLLLSITASDCRLFINNKDKADRVDIALN